MERKSGHLILKKADTGAGGGDVRIDKSQSPKMARITLPGLLPLIPASASWPVSLITSEHLSP